jgi:nardilysin
MEPCFDTLRTKEQLGYTVHSGMRLTHGVLGFAVVIMSGTAPPSTVDARIEAFLSSFWKDRLESMAEEDFERQRAALLASKMVKDRSLGEENERHWEAVASRRYDFDARKEEIEVLQRLTLPQTREFYARHFLAGSEERKKLAVHVVASKDAAELAAPAPENVTLFDGADALRKRLGVWPAPEPAVPLGALVGA